MAITSDLIGRIGGGGTEVHQIPVNFVSSSGTGMKHVADVPVPEGEQARVIVLVYSTSVTAAIPTVSSLPRLYIGGNNLTRYVEGYTFGATSIVTGPVSVEVDRRNSASPFDPSFVGEIFWWEVDE